MVSFDFKRLGVALARAHPGRIHVLLTDVIMPEMNGRAIAERIRSLRVLPSAANGGV